MTRDGKAEGIGATACGMLFISCRAIRGAHDRRINFSACTIVVAHFDCTRKSAPGGPVQLGVGISSRVSGLISKQGSIIHLWGLDDLAGVEEASRVKSLFHLVEDAHHRLAKHRFVKFRSNNAVAVFSRVRSFVFPHHGKGFFGDGSHLLDVLARLHIQDRPDMKASFGGVRIPGPGGAVPVKYVGQSMCVFREIVEWNGTVLYE